MYFSFHSSLIFTVSVVTLFLTIYRIFCPFHILIAIDIDTLTFAHGTLSEKMPANQILTNEDDIQRRWRSFKLLT